MDDYPYRNRFSVNRALPQQGRSREDVLAELRAMAHEEDAFWETGQLLAARCTAATTSTTRS